MSKAHRNAQMSILAQASRVAGHRGGLTTRTRYLTPPELRTVPATQLLRETAWAERPDAPDEWRDQRRDVIADEFYRRGFHDAADTVRSRWEPHEYDGARLIEEQRRLDAERRQLDAERSQTHDREADTAGWAVSTLAVAGTAAAVIEGDQMMQQVARQLDHAWESQAADPAMSGNLDMGIGADLSDSLATAATEPTTAATIEMPSRAASPEVDAEAEL